MSVFLLPLSGLYAAGTGIRRLMYSSGIVSAYRPGVRTVSVGNLTAGGTGTAVGGALATATLIVGLLGMWVAGRAADRGARPAWVFLFGAAGQMPFLVAMITNRSSNRRTANIEVNCSPVRIFNRFTIALPRLVRDIDGIS